MLRSRPLGSFSLPSGRRVPRRRPRPAALAAWERLEERTLLTAFVVNSLADGPVAADGQLTLREALTAANTNAAAGDAAAGSADGDTITFSVSGVIVLTESQFVIADDVRVDGGGTVTVNGNGASRVFFVDAGGGSGSAFDVVLSRLTVTGGDSTGGTGELRGGGIHVTAGDGVTLNDVLVAGNTATSGGGIFNAGSLLVNGGGVNDNVARIDGGGLYIDPAATTTLVGTTVTGNAAVMSGEVGAPTRGGGIYNNYGSLTARDALIAGNSADAAGGGLLTAGGDARLFRTTVRHNAAWNGGGIEVVSGRLVLDASLIELNRANISPNGFGDGDGGGLHVTGSGDDTVTVYRTRIRSNAADHQGGGLWVGGSTMIVDQSIVEDNVVAGDRHDGGGGIFVTDASLLVADSVISGNAATSSLGSGGGVLCRGGFGQAVFYRTIVGGNTAAFNGGGLMIFGGGLVIDQCLLADNTASVTTVVQGQGGGLYFWGTAATVYRTEVRDNVSDRPGGGLWTGGGPMVVDKSIIRNNVASSGGGILNLNGSLLVAASIVVGNAATGPFGSGAGILSNEGDVTVYLSTVGDNTANRAGGGIRVTGGRIVLDRSVLARNTAGTRPDPAGVPGLTGDGGGLYTDAGVTAIVYRSDVQGNYASRRGGGLWNQGGGTLTVDGSSVRTNDAGGTGEGDGGGGIFNGGRLVLSTTDVFSNEATASGGGVYTDAGGVTDLDALERVFANLPDDFAGPGPVV